MKPTEEVLQDLVQYSNISLSSDSKLVRAVADAAAKADEQRAKEAKENGSKGEDNVLRRKPDLQPILGWRRRSIQLTPWEVLHVLTRAIAVSKRGAGRGLAEH